MIRGQEGTIVRIRRLAAAAALAMFVVPAGTAAADTAVPLKRPVPGWYTPQLHARVLAAGATGVPVAQERLNVACPGVAARGVSAGGCIVSPAGCTANFIFTDGRSKYVGTARHCVKGVGSKVMMQVDTATLAVVGSVVKITAGPCPDEDPLGGEEQDSRGCSPGNDFALIRIDPAVASRWGVNPALPVIGGPRGVYAGCAPQPVAFYGHGYGAAVAQGKPQVGLATNWLRDGYGWTGTGIFGDSGSPVVLADGRAAGNFTHINVERRYPGSNLAGMRMTAIQQFLGSRIRLVQAGGGATRSGPATCTSGASGSGDRNRRGSTDGALPDAGDGALPDAGELPVVGEVLGGDDDDDRDDDRRDGDGKGDRDGGGLLGGLGL